MNKDFNVKLNDFLKEINVEINEEKVNKFYEFMKLLLEWNEKMNLTAITEENEVILKHFVDCLTILKYVEDGNNVVDIGTGAGFPGVPLSIMKESANFTLVDSLNKRINFLNEVKTKIKLNNVETIHSRAEEFGQNSKYRENYDIAVSRAVANLAVLVEYLIPTVKVGGQIICMKGSQVDEELKSAEYAINELGGKIRNKYEFCLPKTDIKRNIIIIDKIKNTNKKYPRKAGLPSKQPLSK